jgi:ATP-binding cassette, subfamily B, bacterial
VSATAADPRRLSTHTPNPSPPDGIESRYRPPRATIDPDQSKSWIGRARPVVMAHKTTLFTALTLSFVALVLQVQIPNLLNEAITNSLQRHTVPLSHYVAVVAALAIAAGISAFASRLLLLRTAYALEFDLRNIIYAHLTRMSFGFYDRVQSGQLISRANSDIRSVQMYLTFAPSILVQCAVALVAFGYMLSINVPLAFVAMSTTPLVYFSSVRMRREIFPVSWLIQQRLADVATIVDENTNGVRVVKSFVAEPREVRTLAEAAERLKWTYIQDADIRARFTPTVQNLPQLGLALVLLFGGWLVIHGDLQVGAILAFSAYIVMLQAPFQLLGMLIMLGQRAKASAGRIYQILDEAPAIVDRPGAIELVDCEGDVRLEHVGFAYADGPPVLKDLSLHLRLGETVALVGRTASGKSTISRLLPRFYDVTSGSVRIDGHDVRDVTLASLRSQIGVVLDEPFLFTASIRDNIAYGRPDAALAEVEAAARAAGAGGFIGDLADGYDTVVGERGYTLSGGQRQRIAIARTLLLNPPILILDDATSAVDVQVEQEIHEALRVLMTGRTTLVVAHRLSTIGLADRVVLLDGGRIVADGTHTKLLETVPLYGEVLAQAEEAERQARVRGADELR